MAKIGTAQVEIKPVLNREALDEVLTVLGDEIEARVAAAVRRAMSPGNFTLTLTEPIKWGASDLVDLPGRERA